MPKSSISTKRGDAGQTSLFSGERVDKCSPRTEAYGELDELNSTLGLARTLVQHPALPELIIDLQRDIFTMGAELATTTEKLSKLRVRVDEALVNKINTMSSDLEAEVEIPKKFIIPGGTQAAATLDVARTIARRVERKVVALYRSEEIDNPHVLPWFNRLSDFIWLMARLEEGDNYDVW